MNLKPNFYGGIGLFFILFIAPFIGFLGTILCFIFFFLALWNSESEQDLVEPICVDGEERCKQEFREAMEYAYKNLSKTPFRFSSNSRFLCSCGKLNTTDQQSQCSKTRQKICGNRYLLEIEKRAEANDSTPVGDNEFCLSGCNRRCSSSF